MRAVGQTRSTHHPFTEASQPATLSPGQRRPQACACGVNGSRWELYRIPAVGKGRTRFCFDVIIVADDFGSIGLANHPPACLKEMCPDCVLASHDCTATVQPSAETVRVTVPVTVQVIVRVTVHCGTCVRMAAFCHFLRSLVIVAVGMYVYRLHSHCTATARQLHGNCGETTVSGE